MHHALLISEVFREICDTLDHSSLPAVARTCRAFHDLALDELWRELYSIHPFIHLLGHITPEKGQRTSVQRLTSQQWSTLQKYSSRVRSIYMCMIDDLPHFDQFSCFSDPPNPDRFFSNLRTVAWYPDNHLAMLPFFRLLCGPSLISLSAEFATDLASLDVVATLGTLCPNIINISISASGEILSDSLVNALSISICHWKELEHVSCDELTASAIKHLSQARNLESLTACVSGPMSTFCQSLSSKTLSFPRLQRLHLYAGLLSTATACLRGLRLALKEFWLDLFDAEEVLSGPSSLWSLFNALTDACLHPRLTVFYLTVIHPHFPFPNSVMTIHDIQPLFSFIHLRVVSLEGLPTFWLDDNAIAELASAWPDIEELALSTCVNHPVASLPTFQCLSYLNRACPKLRMLSLVFDATSFVGSPPTSLSETLGSTHSDILEELSVGNAPIHSPGIVAYVLHALYPRLKRVDMSVWNKEPLNRLPRRDWYEATWGRVNVELQRLRGERSETGVS